jgi:hypothetical protein
VINDNLPRIEAPVDIASVTFAEDSDHFFATLSTSRERYLVSGSIRERRLTTFSIGMTNEALSRDGRRLIVKTATGDRGRWQIGVLDLESWQVQPLNHGTRSIDDQIEWLDDDHVVYHDIVENGTGIWKLAINGTSAPELLVRDAYSPAVSR